MVRDLTSRRGRLLALMLGAVMAACASQPPHPTPYQQAEDTYGFSSEDLDTDLVAVRFRGNPSTSEQQVEAGLFRRIVEIAEERDAKSFSILRSDSECVTSLRTSPITTCIYRQSADAMFPYHFGVREVPSIWGSVPVREYEASATVMLLDREDCAEIVNCYLTAASRSSLPPMSDDAGSE
jgi:hypothetical protein